jgi:hypothetical protein
MGPRHFVAVRAVEKKQLAESRKQALCGGSLLALAVIVAAILAIL